MSLLRKANRSEEKDHGLQIEVQCGDKFLNVSDLNRHVRRLMDRQVRAIISRHGDMTHPVTGERPSILFHMEKLGGTGTVRVKTDSDELRAYLASKGVAVLGEMFVEKQPAEAA